MNVNKRDRRDTGGERGAEQRAPRSGGRTTAQRTTRGGTGTTPPERDNRMRESRARGTRDFPTQGSAALAPVERAATPPTVVTPPRLRVAPPPPISVPRAPFVALILVLVVGGVLGVLVVNTKINENALRLDRLQQQQAKLDVDQQQLEQRIAESKAPGNLTANAKKLGLVESGPPAFIRLPDGKVIGVPQPAGGEPSIASQQGAGG